MANLRQAAQEVGGDQGVQVESLRQPMKTLVAVAIATVSRPSHMKQSAETTGLSIDLGILIECTANCWKSDPARRSNNATHPVAFQVKVTHRFGVLELPPPSVSAWRQMNCCNCAGAPTGYVGT